ncbi:hypothetical protein AMJ44_03960 [candidate division WOR-1 bacterium DG_54_3]|uniref:Uncharacterized protein n=1 Tax=candidate division WOR-1 bacterium DG_54_3 TaxID=1703775 RepID=A0A0S7Y561_UNCSA|nr:MAG: hypothetical protein AMJ44_03960 [candidate division WOR-1 bacterium DG_54_3]
MAIKITELQLKINNRPVTISLPPNISQKIGPEMRVAFEEKNVKLKGGGFPYPVAGSLLRKKGLRILYSEKIINGITKGIVSGCDILPERRLELKPLISLMVMENRYTEKYISIPRGDAADSAIFRKGIRLPPEKPALYFIYAKIGYLPSPSYRVWVYMVFDPQKSDGENINETLKNQHIIYSSKKVTLSKKD